MFMNLYKSQNRRATNELSLFVVGVAATILVIIAISITCKKVKLLPNTLNAESIAWSYIGSVDRNVPSLGVDSSSLVFVVTHQNVRFYRCVFHDSSKQRAVFVDIDTLGERKIFVADLRTNPEQPYIYVP